MDAGVLHGMLQQPSNSDGPTIIIFGPSGQVQMGSGIGRPGDSMNTPSVPNPAPPDRNQPADRDQPSDTPSSPTPIIPLTETLTPMETQSPVVITDTPAMKSTTQNSGANSESPMPSINPTSAESSDALPSLRSSSLTEGSRSTLSDSSSLPLPESSTKASTGSSSFLTTPTLTSKSSTETTSGHTSNSSSSSRSQASSLLTSRTAPQVSATAAYRPLSSTSQKLDAHSPSFYIAISVAAVAGAAVVVAIIAWAIRLLTKAKRRRGARHTAVPWGNPPGDKENRLEGGYGDSFSSASGMDSGIQDDLALAQGWPHRGERDFGEIHRGRFDANGIPLRDHPIIPGRTLPADYAFDEVDLGPYQRPNQNLRHLPSHLVDEDLAARARLEVCPVHSPGPPLSLSGGIFAERGPSPVARNEQSPRAASSSYESFEHKVASGGEAAASPCSVTERLRNMERSPVEVPRERLGTLPNSSENHKGEAEAWAASLKNSLVNAFNAVAVNVSGAPRMGSRCDTLTRRGTRQSVRDLHWSEKGSGHGHGTSVSSKDSKPWTLEETREGAGVVHLHINDPREYRARAPSTTITSNDPRTTEPPRPLQSGDTSILAAAHGRSHQRFRHVGISRESSIYSTLSAFPEWRERPSRHGSINPSVHSARNFRSLRVTNLTHDSRKSTLDSVVIQPHPISRLASTASSITNTLDVRGLDANEAASRALRERQKKAS